MIPQRGDSFVTTAQMTYDFITKMYVIQSLLLIALLLGDASAFRLHLLPLTS